MIVITKAEVIGALNGADIYHIRESDIIPYQEKAELHLTPSQVEILRKITHFRPNCLELAQQQLFGHAAHCFVN